uniref:non-specific serine/threonine protein kinase n=1 Tax=Schmidtea mediterranea TaxID=79327 RepID=A0A0H3YJJ1_SCHMD|nr:NEK8-2 [Schmidtea mediterranea]
MSESLSVVIVSSKVRHSNTIHKNINTNTLFFQYRYDVGYDGILGILQNNLGANKIKNLAIVLYSTPFAVYICSNDGKVQQFSGEFLGHSLLQINFFKKLNSFFDLNRENECRIDFLNCNIFNMAEITEITAELKKILLVECSISKDLWGSDIIIEHESHPSKIAAKFYFSINNLISFSIQQTINGFEKIRTVGKGAYGTAVLYRKKDDDSLVILKEINMHDLSATERQLAMNEVKVLSQLDHPNIVAYFDSFEEDGVLMIEMEYADNGTLAQFLSNQEKPLEEKKILEMFFQIVSAIHYIHEHKILHRDLKTVNIFLTKEEIIKIGDFGISKMLSTTHEGANSVIGTPYYISPEMCQGKLYNEKSDVWALGCILYEMTCLHKTFEGSNLPALVNKILKGQFEPVKGSYSDELKELISSLLEKNPDDRLSTEVILHHKLPMMMKTFHTDSSDNVDTAKPQTRNYEFEKRSVVYVMDINTLNLSPVRLPSKIRIKQICSGENHTIVLTTDRTVFTWGSNEFGQLGHGDLVDRKKPELVSSLTQKSLIRIACGNDFSIFGPENGIIMTCGSGISGSLGHGDFKDVLKPRLIESLLTIDVVCISATNSHVVVVSSEDVIYGWGSNKNGQLGLDSLNLYCSPQVITFKEHVLVKNAFTSEDATMLLTETGGLLASGNNNGNKLGLNARLGFLMTMKSLSQQPTINSVHEFTKVEAVMRHCVNQVSMGKGHTTVLCESGKIIAFGINSSGQLGNGSTKNSPIPCEVKTMKKHKITKVTSGSNFTVACVDFNSLYFWGIRQTKKSDMRFLNGNESFKNKSQVINERPIEHFFRPAITSDEFLEAKQFSMPSNANGEINEESNEVMKIFPTPIVILHLKNPENNSKDKELICLTNCITFRDHSLLVQIETTAPPPRRRRSKTMPRIKIHDSSLYGNIHNAKITPKIIKSFCGENSESSPLSYEEGFETETVPTWIKNELIDAANDTQNNNAEFAGSRFLSTNTQSFNNKNEFPKNVLRIYSTSNHDNKLNETLTKKSTFNSIKSLSSRHRSLKTSKELSENPTTFKSEREIYLEKQVLLLEEKLKFQNHQILQNNLIINQLQKEIENLKKRELTSIYERKTFSAVCAIQ